MKKRSMQEPTFLILTALAAGPQHGYAIIADAERISGGVASFVSSDRGCS
jgi:DNA-binding PadR family transcriptional regulator